MDENHQGRVNHKLVTTETKLWLPPSYTNNISPPVPSMPKKRGINWGFAHKSFWEWLLFLGTLLAALGAIAIPFVVTIIGLNFTQQQAQLSIAASERQHQTDLQIALDQQREKTLKSCIDDIRDLLLNKGLRASKPGDEARSVARAEVLLAVRQLDGERKGILMRFLSDAGLVVGKGKDVVIDLHGADLTNADLGNVDLAGTYLNEADLRGADLRGAKLGFAHLEGADLRGAQLAYELEGADMILADLMNDDLHGVNLIGADLRFADLRGAKLGGAYLEGTNLERANLEGTDLRGADLLCADLKGAKIKKEVVVAEAALLEGTIMPDGSIPYFTSTTKLRCGR